MKLVALLAFAMFLTAGAAGCSKKPTEERKEAVTKAERTPPPKLETMFDDVYERAPWHLNEQRAELLRGPRAPSPHG